MLNGILLYMHQFSIWFYGDSFITTFVIVAIIGLIVSRYRGTFFGIVTMHVIIATACIIDLLDKYFSKLLHRL